MGSKELKMFRTVARLITSATQTTFKFPHIQRVPQATAVRQSSTTQSTGFEVKAPVTSQVKTLTEHEENALWEEQMKDLWWGKTSAEEFDHWEMRQTINYMAVDDCIPQPESIISILKGCRNLNDYGLAVRFLETVRLKNGKDKVHQHWPWIMAQIGPEMEKMGISTLEEMGYDDPELWLEPVDDM